MKRSNSNDPKPGTVITRTGIEFTLYAPAASSVDLLLFERADAAEPSEVFALRRAKKHQDFWHVSVPDSGHGQLYGYRVQGPWQPEKGYRFDGDKLLIDPYARAVAGMEIYDRKKASLPGNNIQWAPKCVAIDNRLYDWEDDQPLNWPSGKKVIYEMHVAGFTKHRQSGIREALRGCYAGLIEKIPYLQQLGVDAVELLPVHQFDRYDAPPGRINYWGYSPIAFFAPHAGYCSAAGDTAVVDEFRDMVKALHKAGIRVILDVVFNHSGEVDLEGPTLSFRGIADHVYYLQNPESGEYLNYTGCGNTINANHPRVQQMILDCLRYWVSEMHVDGFRFDLASILVRGTDGQPMEKPPLIAAIEKDPVLKNTYLVAEAWDAAGLYLVGEFPGKRFSEWNGPFRDNIRRFVRSENDTVVALEKALAGSPDLFSESWKSINFITAHDGFTLNDLVSYNEKHNFANGENNRDGSDANFSWNCGVEGPTDDEAVLQLRRRQVRNLMLINLVSRGSAMIVMGDEILRTQSGNNNAYCQDNELSWMDWQKIDSEADFLRFTTLLIDFVKQSNLLNGRSRHALEYRWGGLEPGQPDRAGHSHSLALEISAKGESTRLYLAFNAYWEHLSFNLPEGKNSRRIIDTSLPAPHDFTVPEKAPLIDPAEYYSVSPRSCIMLTGTKPL